ncbi:unnamed protein product, partial [Iphiclides podalirius]
MPRFNVSKTGEHLQFKSLGWLWQWLDLAVRRARGEQSGRGVQFAQWQLHQFASVAFARRYSVNATGILRGPAAFPV